MAPLIGFLLKAAIPVVVKEIQEKIADKKPHLYEEPKEVPAKEYVVPAVKAITVGSVKSKSQWFAAFVIALGVFVSQNQELVLSLLPPQYLGLAVSAIGAISFFLRSVSTESIVEKAEPKE